MHLIKSRLFFYFMAVAFKIRDTLKSRKKVLEEVNIKPGYVILDFGCGPGSYTFIASEMAGKEGKVYATDTNPSVIQHISKKASSKHVLNIETIQTDCATPLADKSIDVVLMYDLFHMLHHPKQVLAEMQRVLKNEGILSFNDHHMKESNILTAVEGSGLFRLKEKKQHTYAFSPLT